MKEPLLTDQGVFDGAFAQLLELDDRLVPVAEVAGRPALRRRPPGFAGLCAVVIAQQLSVASARAISARFEAALGGTPTVEAMLAAPQETLRGAGLSAPKIRTLTGIARALAEGEVDLEAVARLEADAAAEVMTRLPGIGLWTADIYLLFCLGRADAFPHGDLALQVAMGDAFELGGRCTPLGLRAIAEDWRPLRGVAAHLLWAYYGARRARLGAPA
ncbi:DNA-3-methyladenine glycosylase 2 family protein [Xanthobacter autotrophicus]|uniref:DNA-3-methyladenine glycosylase family protein n=1 Tax=Xanthobacter autotrophicus TaxID=280 RepID=UPI001E2954A4|nr:DNA-3-methyladenine glycosylase 2 family protein [Xanthobacter autotrophicus]UDQ89299.1 DNA-3-methyladenine glycosylase 2 family protein [Xanthobacter autotrophicus]